MNESSMIELCKANKYDTDKYYYHNKFAHCYVEEFYGKRFLSRAMSAKKILEVGIGVGGGSLLLWKDFFQNGFITGIDVDYCPKVATQSRISQVITDAYNKDFVDTLKDSSYDVLVDDGPHTFESMVNFLKLYLPKLSPNGILVIEDIPDPAWCREFIKLIPNHYKPYTEVLDMRELRRRFDDVLMIIDLPH